MDPKSLSGLDPKLRETYERVMGAAESQTPTSQGTPPPPNTSANNTMPTFDATPTPTSSSPIPPPVDTPTATSQADQSADLNTLQPSLTPNPAQEPTDQTQNSFQPLPSPAQINQMPAQEQKSTSTLIKILYIVAGIIFFIVYAIFWLKIFKFPLPF